MCPSTIGQPMHQWSKNELISVLFRTWTWPFFSWVKEFNEYFNDYFLQNVSATATTAHNIAKSTQGKMQKSSCFSTSGIAASAPQSLEGPCWGSLGGRGWPQRRPRSGSPWGHRAEPYCRYLWRVGGWGLVGVAAVPEKLIPWPPLYPGRWRMEPWCCRYVRPTSTSPFPRSSAQWGRSQQCRYRRCQRP